MAQSTHSLTLRLGIWTGLAPIPDFNLEKLEPRLEGEDKEAFLDFLRKMLRWKPEERLTAGEVILDPWLLMDLFEPRRS